jgi:hypothetical protein
VAAIDRAGVVRFHCVGDTGGWRDDRPQRGVAEAMVDELRSPAGVDFFYHLGDVVYPHGEEAGYSAQFFSPLRRVPRAHLRRPRQPRRGADPGLKGAIAGGVCEDLLLGDAAAARRRATLILAMHQPVYSVDVVHGSNLELGKLLDECFARAGRAPDAVFTGHAHNYQRFARRLHGRQIPYLVAGSGGFHERHAVGTGLPDLPAVFPGVAGVTLESFQCSEHGFMTVSARRTGAEVVYSTVSDGAARHFDSFRIAPGRST